MPLALVTGAAGFLGTALAHHLASKGYKLALVDRFHSQERLASLVTDLGGAAHGKAADVSSTEDMRMLVHALEKEAHEPVSHAALVAGGWAGGEPMHSGEHEESFGAMMSANAETVWQTLRAVLPGMVLRKHGSVVVIGSRNVERPWTGANAAAYTASKSAAVSLARATAAEVVDHGVRVNALLISTMDTPANRRAMPNADPARWVPLESAARVVSFLFSDDARDVSGAEIPVYGRA